MAGPTGLFHLIGVNVTHTCFDLTPRLSPFPKCVCVCWGVGGMPCSTYLRFAEKRTQQALFSSSLSPSLSHIHTTVHIHAFTFY